MREFVLAGILTAPRKDVIDLVLESLQRIERTVGSMIRRHRASAASPRISPPGTASPAPARARIPSETACTRRSRERSQAMAAPGRRDAHRLQVLGLLLLASFVVQHRQDGELPLQRRNGLPGHQVGNHVAQARPMIQAGAREREKANSSAGTQRHAARRRLIGLVAYRPVRVNPVQSTWCTDYAIASTKHLASPCTRQLKRPP